MKLENIQTIKPHKDYDYEDMVEAIIKAKKIEKEVKRSKTK